MARNERIGVSLTRREKAVTLTLAEAEGLPVSAYIRRMLYIEAKRAGLLLAGNGKAAQPVEVQDVQPATA